LWVALADFIAPFALVSCNVFRAHHNSSRVSAHKYKQLTPQCQFKRPSAKTHRRQAFHRYLAQKEWRHHLRRECTLLRTYSSCWNCTHSWIQTLSNQTVIANFFPRSLSRVSAGTNGTDIRLGSIVYNRPYPCCHTRAAATQAVDACAYMYASQ
jgi:hypothetical protein